MERGGEAPLQKREQAPALHKGRMRRQWPVARSARDRRHHSRSFQRSAWECSPQRSASLERDRNSRGEWTQSAPDARPHAERGNEELQFVVPARIAFVRPPLSSSHRHVRNLGPLRTRCYRMSDRPSIGGNRRRSSSLRAGAPIDRSRRTQSVSDILVLTSETTAL
jgi:hypothetical protein